VTFVSGNVLTNLDEFKLRLGHLSLLCEASCVDGGTLYRLEQGLIHRLTEQVVLSNDEIGKIATYLYKKKLCKELGATSSRADDKFRYPFIAYEREKKNITGIVNLESSSDPLEIWFQDYCLADSNIRSRTGAITVSGKSGSKTGVSHIIDWGKELGLISKSGSATPIATIISHYMSDARQDISKFNPYIVGPERIALGYAYISSDFDVFVELLRILARESGSLSRNDARAIYVEAVENLARRVEGAPNISAKISNSVFSLWRDLDKASKKSKKEINKTSTAWHRASSRFETLTDLGLLSKTRGGNDHRYEYRYFVEDSTRFSANLLSEVETMENWLDVGLVSALYIHNCTSSALSRDELISLLHEALIPIKRSTAPISLSAVAIAVAAQCAKQGTQTSLQTVKQLLREMAIARPDAVKLSKGVVMQSEGMISIDLQKI
jgi:hypothetical protein